MARGTGEPSTKRAKVDEAGKEEEEGPLVRRKEELVRLLKKASAKGKGKGNTRAKKELLTLCTDFEAKNEKLLGRLPPELWEKIVDEYLHQNDLFALAMTCRFFRDTTEDIGWEVETNLYPYHLLELRKSGKMTSYTLGWFRWVCDTFEILPSCEWDDDEDGERVEGAVYEGDLVNYAALQGSVEILRWLVEEKGWELNEDTGWRLGQGGSIEVLEYVKVKGYVFDERACNGAAREGRLEALKFLRGLDPPCPWDEMTCANAAGGGHLEVLKWLRAQDPPCPWGEKTCTYAAEAGHLEVLKWLRAQDPPCPWDAWSCNYAAEAGHLEVLKWLRAQNPPCPWSAGTCAAAAERGQLEVLKWLRAQKLPCPWSAWTCSNAARGGRLDVLKWARAQEPPCPWSEKACARAASGGHLDILKFLRGQDPPCPWDEETCAMAASWGHLEVLKWLCSQDPPCPWDERTWEWAAVGGNLDVLKWLEDQNPPCPFNEETCEEAARAGQLEALKFLRGLENEPCPWNRRECRATAKRKGHQHVVKWIDEQEYENLCDMDPPSDASFDSYASPVWGPTLDELNHWNIVQQEDESDVEYSDDD
ncbi:putative ankyrin repeat protein [Chloropicon roscoffensis]|uniref:Ankyrin repeat protein n=1 Tax=Chloropicon roscoffensis TaxID=1461544 RepID=A0AAX4P369_9CHLO